MHLNPLNVLHKRAIRIINHAPFLAHTEPLFRESNILKINDQYKLSLATYIYKNPHLIDDYRRLHPYNTRHRDDLLPPRHGLRSTQQSVLFNAINEWNTVPQNINYRTTVSGFKNGYKKVLLDSYVN